MHANQASFALFHPSKFHHKVMTNMIILNNFALMKFEMLERFCFCVWAIVIKELVDGKEIERREEKDKREEGTI